MTAVEVDQGEDEEDAGQDEPTQPAKWLVYLRLQLSAAGPVPFWMAPGSGSGFGSQCKSGMYRILILLQIIYASKQAYICQKLQRKRKNSWSDESIEKGQCYEKKKLGNTVLRGTDYGI